MRLTSDPMLIIEYFLWRRKAEYAISNHYDRHSVWEEVLQNKRLNKYNHTAIDEQFNFYQSDGFLEFDPSSPNNPLPSCASPSHLSSLWMFGWALLVNTRIITVESFLLLQMFLRVHLLLGRIHQCQIYFHVFGSMKLIDLHLVIN